MPEDQYMEINKTAESFDNVVLLYSSLTTLISSLLLAWALITVCRHQRISKIVKFYLFWEHGLRLLQILINYLWGMACFVWTVERKSWLELALGFVYQCLSITVLLSQLALSINRFFAIAFEGRFYDRLWKCWKPQALLFAVLPILPTLVTLITHNRTFFHKQIFTFLVEPGIWASLFVWAMLAVFPIIIWTTTLILDVIMMMKLYAKRRNGSAHTTTLSTDWRLGLQMFVNHLVDMVYLIDCIVALLFAFDVNTFYLFVINSEVLMVLAGLYGLNVVVFLSVRKKVRKRSVIPMTVFTNMKAGLPNANLPKLEK